jgi:hypothetical protein
MGRRLTVALTTTFLCLASQAHAQSPEERAGARALIAKHGNAVVFVLGTTKLRINQGGKEVPTADQRIQSLVTIIDGSGLGVMSLTVLDPSDMLTAQLSRGRGAGAGVSVTTEPAELRYRLADGKEIPVRVVLRDKDLDLAFLRPVDKPATPLAAIEAAPAKPQPIDAVVVLQRLPELASWQPTALFYSVQAVLEKPRLFYLLTGGIVGSPVFDTKGGFLGVILRLKNEGDAANVPPVVLPANDIREVAKQAN